MYKFLKVANRRIPLFFFVLGLSQIVQAANTPVFIGYDLNGRPCAGEYQGYGPFDYKDRNRFLKELKKVEDYHFTQDVEFLIRGSTNTAPYKDIAYTLRAWPNHHRALNAITRYQLRLNRINRSIPVAAECWFQRAIHFSPEDATTYMLYGNFLQKNGKLKLAKNNYEVALKLKPNGVQTHYNLGLLLVQQKEYEEAKKHAKIAYSNAFPLPGLKNQLKALGYWP